MGVVQFSIETLVPYKNLLNEPEDQRRFVHGSRLGNEPYQKEGWVLIRTNAPYYKQATYRLLVNASGATTPAGKHYEDEVGQCLLTEGVRGGETFNDKQAVNKRGSNEYIKLRNDTEAVVRSWDGTK